MLAVDLANAGRASRASTADGSKRLSALAAASKVLQGLPAKEVRAGLSAAERIVRMAAAGLWTSPVGRTPAATLYAAITREIAAKRTTRGSTPMKKGAST